MLLTLVYDAELQLMAQLQPFMLVRKKNKQILHAQSMERNDWVSPLKFSLLL
jgi:hypothetical protein